MFVVSIDLVVFIKVAHACFVCIKKIKLHSCNEPLPDTNVDVEFCCIWR